MNKKISISFKEKEMNIYKYLQSKINASYYIKTLVLKDMKKDKNLVEGNNNEK